MVNPRDIAGEQEEDGEPQGYSWGTRRKNPRDIAGEQEEDGEPQGYSWGTRRRW